MRTATAQPSACGPSASQRKSGTPSSRSRLRALGIVQMPRSATGSLSVVAAIVAPYQITLSYSADTVRPSCTGGAFKGGDRPRGAASGSRRGRVALAERGWVGLTRSEYRQGSHRRACYSAEEVDYFGCVDGDGHRYLIPIQAVEGMYSISVRKYAGYRLPAWPADI